MDTGHLRNKIAIQVGFRGDKMLQEKLMKGIFLTRGINQIFFFFNKGLERNEGNRKSQPNRREQKLSHQTRTDSAQSLTVCTGCNVVF